MQLTAVSVRQSWLGTATEVSNAVGPGGAPASTPAAPSCAPPSPPPPPPQPASAHAAASMLEAARTGRQGPAASMSPQAGQVIPADEERPVAVYELRQAGAN